MRVEREGVRKEGRRERWDRKEVRKKDGRAEETWEGERKRKPGHD